ncbi:MAG: hypothetical protein ACO1OR_04330 [Hydrogenophaga sp.]|uniref:hypothetical protein n=1 Tax=Hydrogenophaga intermedia TaxID=65786 RepID=UPI00204351B6|nr:hypothetical protein [Hydrogenophaga intermedia]
MSAAVDILSALRPVHAVWLALAIVGIELVLRALLALRGPRRAGWLAGLWHGAAGLALLLALLEALGPQRTAHLLLWLALGGVAHALTLLKPGRR